MTSIDLREDIAELKTGDSFTDRVGWANADAMLAFLAAAAKDDARLRVVLEVLGLEVRYGDYWDGESAPGIRPEDDWFVLPPVFEDHGEPVLVCRVRPREEETK